MTPATQCVRRFPGSVTVVAPTCVIADALTTRSSRCGPRIRRRSLLVTARTPSRSTTVAPICQPHSRQLALRRQRTLRLRFAEAARIAMRHRFHNRLPRWHRLTIYALTAALGLRNRLARRRLPASARRRDPRPRRTRWPARCSRCMGSQAMRGLIAFALVGHVHMRAGWRVPALRSAALVAVRDRCRPRADRARVLLCRRRDRAAIAALDAHCCRRNPSRLACAAYRARKACHGALLIIRQTRAPRMCDPAPAGPSSIAAAAPAPRPATAVFAARTTT